MKKILIPLALLAALSACVPVAPYQTGGPGLGTPEPNPYPETYDLPAHCFYDAYGQIICNN